MSLLKIKSAEYISDFNLKISFSNNTTLICDLESIVKQGVFKQIKNKSKFKMFAIESGVLVWPHDIDIAPEFLYKIGQPLEKSKKKPVPTYIKWEISNS